MLCQYCNHQEADYRFFYTYNGQSGDVHLCKDCAEKLHRQYQQFMKLSLEGLHPEQAQTEAGGWESMFPESMMEPLPDSNRVPPDAGEKIKLRRRLNELRAQLQKAIHDENYEQAIRLRDEIAITENKVTP